MGPVVAGYAYWILFAWTLANQGGVPVPVVPALVGAGALAGSGHLSILVILAVAVAGALGADLGWYSLGRWRGAWALEVLGRVFPRAGRFARYAEQVFLGRATTFQLAARFLPELNPIAAGLAGVTRLRLARFIGYGAMGALAWAGAWVAMGYLLDRTLIEVSAHFHIPLLGFGLGALLLYLPVCRARRHRLLRALRATRISPDELKARLDRGEPTIILDLRVADEVAAVPYGLPGAVWILPDELCQLSRGVRHGTLVVLYGGGAKPAGRARATLCASSGPYPGDLGIRKVRVLAGGLHAWELRGYPVKPLGTRLIAGDLGSGAAPR
jgi:membrane protein DedA with SNARE-associated domain